jgi:ribosomal protein S18 acetylase RimI-like enzyme
MAWKAPRGQGLRLKISSSIESEHVKIGPASWRDFPSVLALERLCFDKDSWPIIDLIAALTFPATVRLKAEVDGRLVGFVLGDRRRRKGLSWIATLGVHPEFRRQGIGTRLLQVCERELDTPRVRLTLRESNTAAHELYLRQGYEDVGRWTGYYYDQEDGIVMEKRMPFW